MTLDRLRRIGITLFILCALPAFWPVLEWLCCDPTLGRIVQEIIDWTILFMGVVLFVCFAHMIVTAFTGETWHT